MESSVRGIITFVGVKKEVKYRAILLSNVFFEPLSKE